jgi:hypothetical protein
MSQTKKPKKPKKTTVRKPIIWPPEEWPEEARQAQIAADRAFLDKWWEFVLSDTQKAQPQRTAEIIPFPKAKR